MQYFDQKYRKKLLKKIVLKTMETCVIANNIARIFFSSVSIQPNSLLDNGCKLLGSVLITMNIELRRLAAYVSVLQEHAQMIVDMFQGCAAASP